MSASEPVGVRMRVLVYNIRHGQGIGGLISTRRIAKVIAATGCDVALVTEVWRVPGRFDQPLQLAEATGMTPRFHALEQSFGRQAGNLVLSRLPVLRTVELDLGGRRERRGCLLADVELASREVTVGVTHLALHRETRASQLAHLEAELPRDVPLIVGGDFNCGRAELEPLCGLLAFAADVPPTYPSPLPFRALDHVGASEHWRLTHLEALRSWASDHLPLVADLELQV